MPYSPRSRVRTPISLGSRSIRPKKDEQEFGLAKKEYILCPRCESVYFSKSWHHSFGEEKKGHLKESKRVREKMCPACIMARDGLFEGELLIILPSQDHEARRDIINAVENSDRLAQERDPMDRVIKTEIKPEVIRVLTSENQLAVKIGKKLKASFRGSKLSIKHSKDEDIIRVQWEMT